MHYSVLLNEVIENLCIKSSGVYVDATLGYAGHSSLILKKLDHGFLYGFDQDILACTYSEELLSKINSNFKIFNSNFTSLKESLNGEHVDGIIFDLGFSSPQIDDANRGFSFMNDGPLDMRMGKSGKSAKNVIDTYSKEELSKVFFNYGEEKLGRVIASKIVDTKESINTTLELVEAIKSAVGANYFYKQHPERKIFQALRIEVNDELGVLKIALKDAIMSLKPGGRICVITFHSLEDRIVKNIFKEYSEVDELVKGLPVLPKEFVPILKIVNKKVILPSEKEISENSRSKSAKLRVAERMI